MTQDVEQITVEYCGRQKSDEDKIVLKDSRERWFSGWVAELPSLDGARKGDVIDICYKTVKKGDRTFRNILSWGIPGDDTVANASQAKPLPPETAAASRPERKPERPFESVRSFEILVQTVFKEVVAAGGLEDAAPLSVKIARQVVEAAQADPHSKGSVEPPAPPIPPPGEAPRPANGPAAKLEELQREEQLKQHQAMNAASDFDDDVPF